MSRPQKGPTYLSHTGADGKVRARTIIDGKTHYLGDHGSPESYLLFAKIREKWEAKYSGTSAEEPPAPVNPTIKEVLARWFLHAEAEYSERGQELKNFLLSVRPLERLYGDMPATDFKPLDLERLQRAMADGSWMTDAEKKRYEKHSWQWRWSRKLINRRIVRIRTVWRWAESRGLVPANSWTNLRTVKSVPKTAQWVRVLPGRGPTNWETVKAILPYCHPPVAVMIQLQWWTGMRSCEVRIMRTCDIDDSGPVWQYRPQSDKNDWREHERPKVIQLGPECQQLLTSWLQPDNPTEYLFRPTRQGKYPCYTQYTYPQAIRRACALADVSMIPYACRHAAKRRITRSDGLDAARAMLGQKSIQTTDGYDAEIDQEYAAEIAKKRA